MSLIYQTFLGPANGDTTVATGQGIKLVLPVHQTLKIVEFGIELRGADPTGAVLKLQYTDGAASPNTVDLVTLTVPAAALDGDIISTRVDVLVDKLLDVYRVSTRTVADPAVSTPGTDVSEADGFVKVQLNLTTGVAATTGTVYLVAAYCGSQLTAGSSQILA